jgi:energy-coupling factor transport system ATP-binding protein
MRTPVLVLDEPTAGLDPQGRRELLGLLARLADDRDLTLVVCSASLQDASLLCDRVVVLDGGRVAMDGPLREVLRRGEDLAALDVTLPEPIAAAHELRKLFPDLSADPMTEDDLERELLQRLGTA